jgi:hypothetical protein
MPIPKLSQVERDAALAELPDWALRGDGLAIEREFRFRNFSEAWKQFHDTFLSYGGPPVPLVRRAMMDEDAPRAVF